MTDPKDELGARFENRRADRAKDTRDTSDTGEASDASDTGQASHPDNSGNTSNSGYSNDSGNSDDASSAGEASDADEASKPGPAPSADATRNRKQMPMYLPESQIEALNKLYDRLDARSKLADEGGIEKHKDFMETLAAFAIENEDELARRLGLDESNADSSR